jgi:hypothetical protein
MASRLQQGFGKGRRILNSPRRVPLPPAVAKLYDVVAELEAAYPCRKFTPDGHLVGSIGEVVAAEALGLTLYPSMSHTGHDGRDANGRDVQIKLTSRDAVSMNGDCDRLIVLRIVSPHEAEIAFDLDGHEAWTQARKPAKNGQRVITFARLRQIALAASRKDAGFPSFSASATSYSGRPARRSSGAVAML